MCEIYNINLILKKYSTEKQFQGYYNNFIDIHVFKMNYKYDYKISH